MLQMSKLIQSRNEWRNKANKGAEENREHRRTHKRHRETIAELKLKVKELEQKIDEDKKSLEIEQAKDTQNHLRAIDCTVDRIIS